LKRRFLGWLEAGDQRLSPEAADDPVPDGAIHPAVEVHAVVVLVPSEVVEDVLGSDGEVALGLDVGLVEGLDSLPLVALGDHLGVENQGPKNLDCC